MIVYKITNKINNKVYIGLTTQSLKYRWGRHVTEARNPNNCKHLYKAMRKYGENNFMIEIIEETDDFQKLGELERYYIKLFDSTNPQRGYNLTCGGEKNQYDGNSQAKLKISDVIFIRQEYAKCNLNLNECWKLYYPQMSYGGFQKIWDGTTWKGIMDEVYTKENIDFHKNQNRSHPGEKNANAKYTDSEVLEIRKYYVSHTLKETYEKFNKGEKMKTSFRNLIDCTYRHLPIYSKLKHCWFLKDKPIDIEKYNPVSTIYESVE